MAYYSDLSAADSSGGEDDSDEDDDFALAPTFDSLAVRLALCLAKLAGELVLLASSKSILSELASAALLLGVEVDLRRPGTAAGRDDSSLVISSWVSW